MEYLSKEWRPLLLSVSFFFGILFFIILDIKIFEILIPIHLWLTFILVFFQAKNLDYKAFLFFVFSGSLGFLAEYLGVRYGILFGDYHYSNKMGTLIFGVPITIVLMWFLLTYSIGVFLTKIFNQRLLIILFGASLNVCIDFILEPLAVRLGWWVWESKEIPLFNYLSWFIISVIIMTMYTSIFKTKRVDKAAIAYILSTAIFFVIMNFLIKN